MYNFIVKNLHGVFEENSGTKKSEIF